MDLPAPKLIRICDATRRKSIIKCPPTISAVLSKGETYFNKRLSRVVLEADGFMISENDVLEMCISDGFTFMLLGEFEIWQAEIGTSSTGMSDSTQETNSILCTSVLSNTSAVEQSADDSQLSDMSDQIASVSGTSNFIMPILEDQPHPPTSQIVTLLQINSTDVTNDAVLATSQDPQENSVSFTADIQRPAKINASVAMQFTRFDVNWKAIPSDILTQLECPDEDCNFSGLSETGYNRLVDQVVGQLRVIATRIPATVFRQVASKITTKYSILLDIDDEGTVVGDGSGSLAEKMRNHNSYLNRSYKPGMKLKHKLGKHPSRQCWAGVKEDYYASGEPNVCKDSLMKLTRGEITQNDVITKTVKYIRYKIDNSETLKQLIIDLPVLRKTEVLDYHFEMATGVKPETFEKNFKLKRNKLIEISKTYRDKSIHIKDDNELQYFTSISKMLKEDFSTIIFFFEQGHPIENLNIAHPFPVLAAFDRGDATIYYVHAEGTVLTNGCGSIVTAIQSLFEIYYIYFFHYPKELSKTLEFLQIFLLRIVPDKGTRSTATIVAKQQRLVRGLLMKIAKLRK